MTAPPRPPRTLVASVLFVDLVDFSEKSVSEQIEVKRALTRVLRRILSSISAEDYRLMDTGDGAALGFLSDPEHALYFALAIDAACRDAEPASGLGPGTLRIGINLGPVKDVFDVNDRPNLIGDGINTAQRIVGFAEPGQITMSRSFFELVSRLAPEYSGIFVHVGVHDDKHGREHDLYVIKPARDMLGKIQERLQLVVAEATGINVVFTQKQRDAMPAVNDDAVPAPELPASIPASAPAEAQTLAPASVALTASPARSRWWSIAIVAAVVLVGGIILTPLLTKKASNKPALASPVVSPAATPSDAASAKSLQAAPPATVPAGASSTASLPTKSTTPASSTSTPVSPSTKDQSSATSASPATPPGTVSPPTAGAFSGPTSSAPTRPTTGNTGTSGASSAVDKASTRRGRAPSPAKRPTATDANDDAPAPAADKSGGSVGRGSYSRCSTLMQKATLGESLTADERREMGQFCR